MKRLVPIGAALAILAAIAWSPARATPHKPDRYAVIIVLDGARPNYFNLVPMPHLRALQRRGTTFTNATVGQLIAITPTSHATIGTGEFPKHHGVMGFWWKDPKTNALTRPTDLGPVNQGALEAVLTDHHVHSLAAAVKKAYPNGRVAALSGHKCYAADAMGTADADYILCAAIYHDRWVATAMGRHQPPPGAVNNHHFDVPIPPPTSGFGPQVQQWRLGQENDWTTRYALWIVHRARPRLLMINLPETDVAMHFAGSNMKVAATLMRHFDRELGRLVASYRRAGILSRTDWIITADHGMSVIHQRLPFSVLHAAIKDAGATQVTLEADTAAAISITQNSKARAVAENVFRLGGRAIDAAYYKVHNRSGWSYRPAAIQADIRPAVRREYLALCDTTASASGPDVLAIYAPHVTTGDRTAGPYHWLAGHLGPQWDEQHIPLIIAGPGVRHGTSGYPARLVDIAPTVETLLGAPIPKVDGHPLASALAHPTRKAQQEDRRLAPALMANVDAQRSRSGD
ncbi:MAG TPA: alkaline phosphatase family protein [Chloroflexota bacterium]|nr:alkaline phosphatase family protein [Chloroflexota bacterium]